MFLETWVKYLSPEQLIDYKNFQKFMVDNNAISTTVGVLVAYAAWNFIQSLVGDIVLPGTYFLFISPFISNKFVSSVFEPVNKLNLPKFFTELLSFLTIIFFTYLLIQYVIKNWTNTATSANVQTSQTPSPQVIQGNTISQTITNDNSNYKEYSSFTSLGTYSS